MVYKVLASAFFKLEIHFVKQFFFAQVVESNWTDLDGANKF